MAEPIGPGDVVEAVRDIRLRRGGGPLEEVMAARGTRDVVVRLCARRWPCLYCGALAGMMLSCLPIGPACLCGWRRIGGSQAETVRHFAEDLTVPAPTEREPATA